MGKSGTLHRHKTSKLHVVRRKVHMPREMTNMYFNMKKEFGFNSPAGCGVAYQCISGPQ